MGLEKRGANSWRIEVSAGVDPRTGRRQRVRETVKGDRAAAERREMQLILEVGEGVPAEFSLSMTVADMLRQWLPIAPGLADYTRYDYGLAIEKHIVPSKLGKMPAHKVKPFDLDRFYRQLERDGLGPDRIRRCHAILRGAYKRAVVWEWVVRNPALHATPPPPPIRDIDSLEPSDYRRLSAHAHDSLLRLAVIIDLAADIGPRRGEICGLQWPDFNLDKGVVKVIRTVAVVPGVGDVVKTIKGNPRRRLEAKPLTPQTINSLRLWDIATSEERSLGANPKDWVFLAPKAMSFYRPDCLGHDFRRLAAEAGMPGAHLHQLRHYVVTQLIDAGIDVDIASRRVGHSRTSTTTDYYGDGVPSSAWTAAEAMERINRGDD